jgi:hypothetical protein
MGLPIAIVRGSVCSAGQRRQSGDIPRLLEPRGGARELLEIPVQEGDRHPLDPQLGLLVRVRAQVRGTQQREQELGLGGECEEACRLAG